MGSKLTHRVQGTRCTLTVVFKKRKTSLLTSLPGWEVGDNAGSTVPVRAAACLGHTTHEKESRYCYIACLL